MREAEAMKVKALDQGADERGRGDKQAGEVVDLQSVTGPKLGATSVIEVRKVGEADVARLDDHIIGFSTARTLLRYGGRSLGLGEEKYGASHLSGPSACRMS